MQLRWLYNKLSSLETNAGSRFITHDFKSSLELQEEKRERGREVVRVSRNAGSFIMEARTVSSSLFEVFKNGVPKVSGQSPLSPM